MRPISTNPGSLEAESYGLTRGKCFLWCRLELDAVAGLLWIRGVSWVGRIFSCFCFSYLFFPSNAHGLLQVGGRLDSFTFLLVRT